MGNYQSKTVSPSKTDSIKARKSTSPQNLTRSRRRPRDSESESAEYLQNLEKVRQLQTSCHENKISDTSDTESTEFTFTKRPILLGDNSPILPEIKRRKMSNETKLNHSANPIIAQSSKKLKNRRKPRSKINITLDNFQMSNNGLKTSESEESIEMVDNSAFAKTYTSTANYIYNIMFLQGKGSDLIVNFKIPKGGFFERDSVFTYKLHKLYW